MEVVDPIDVGASLKTTVHSEVIRGRVANIWIDEDGTAHLSISWKTGPWRERPKEKVSYSDLREMMEAGEIERTNSGHEAWKWRNDT